MISFRQAVADDIPSLFRIRIATWHNPHGAEELAACGITPDSVRARLETDHSGWIAFNEERPVAFAMANSSNGELWVIAVLREFEGRGIGRELMKQAEAWLFSHGWDRIWLTTFRDESARAVGFYRHLGWTDWKVDGDRYLQKSNPRETIHLEEKLITCRDTSYSRLLRWQSGPSDQPHRLYLLLDGEHYWRDMDAVPVLNRLTWEGRIPRMTFALVGHVSGAARHVDYMCNASYAEYIAETILPWLAKEVPNLLPTRHLIGGLSLSGLMATYISLRYGTLFAACLSQSGSHWWKPEWFAEFVRNHSPVSSRYWLSVGNEETATGVKHPPTGLYQGISQIEGVKRAVRVLEEAGAAVRFHEYAGGHAMAPWRRELEHALPWLVGEADRTSSEDLGASS